MPRVFSVVNSKGGVGKSTLSIILAQFLQGEGVSVALCDMDTEQGSTSALAGNIPVVIFDEIPDSDYQLVIIDNPPYLADRMPEVYALSDFVLVPTLPSIIDAMAVRQVIAEIVDSGAPYGLVLNRVKPGTLLTSQIREELVKMGFSVLKSELIDRVSYQRAIIRKSLQATEDEKMIAEVSRLSGEIFRLLTVR